MITFYYDTSNLSSRKADLWFDNAGIEVQMRRLPLITREDLLHILYLSENGFPDIMKKEGKTLDKHNELMKEILDMNVSDGVNFILLHPELLRSPLIFDEHKLMVGYNVEKIRAFIPRQHRRLQLV